jgi:precorrin-3B C17-methyltransferase
LGNNSKSKAEAENKISIVGIGPGDRSLRTIQAEETIRQADYVVGFRPYLELISDLLPGKEVISGSMGREVDRARAAAELLEKGSVALVSSGDPNIYGMAGLGLEVAGDALSRAEVVPGVTSFTAAACRAGLIFRNSVAVVSLSDLLTPWADIEGRLRLAAEQGMPIALYNPKSRKRDWQLLKALAILGPEKAALVAKNVGRRGEELFWTTAQSLLEDESLRDRIDMTTLVILGGRGAFRGEAVHEAEINIVGIGSGHKDQLTIEAKRLLNGSVKIFGAERYLELIGGISSAEKMAHSGPCPERMAARLQEASSLAEKGQRSSILTGGDPSIFSSAWRILEEAGGSHRAGVHIAPGLSAFSAVAANAGAPLISDFALFGRADEAGSAAYMAGAGYGVVVYNARGHDIEPMLREVDPGRPCVLARDVGRAGEEAMVMKAGDLLEAKPSGFRFTLLIASGRSYIKEGRIIARRGYEAKYSY